MSKRKQEDPEARSSKKARVDQVEDESGEMEENPLFADVSDGMGLFGKLPKELLEKLCNNLNPRDILNLSETCKALNKQISLNKYIMKHITLTIPTVDQISEVDFGKRIYLNLVYLRHAMTDFKHIRPGIKKIAANLQSIKFPEKAYYSSAVKALSYMPNVRKVIDFPYRINFNGRRGRYRRNHPGILADPEALNFTNLKELTMKRAGQELSVFEGCDQLEHFAVIQVEYPDLFQEFLSEQNSLQSLEFTWPERYDFYDTEEDSASNFNLKKLRINFNYSATVFTDMKANIERFLSEHRESLESFATNNDLLLPLLQDFPVLNEISLKISGQGKRNLTRTFPVMPLVEKLDVEFEFKPRRNGTIDDNVYLIFPSLDCFPNLKEFRGKKLHSSSNLAHNGIEVISLDSCTFPDISMPKLKSAKFTNIEGRSVIKWVKAVIKNPSAKLEMLEIKDVEMPVKCRKIIEKNRIKFPILIMENVTEQEA